MKLPVWRTIAGFAVLGSLVAVLLALAPAYVSNASFTRTLGGIAQSPQAKAADDNGVRDLVMAQAKTSALPVNFSDIKVSRSGGKVGIQLKYAVHINIAGLYRVDLHFHPQTK